MKLEPNSLDWNGNELEHELELEDMKRTNMGLKNQNGPRFTQSARYSKNTIIKTRFPNNENPYSENISSHFSVYKCSTASLQELGIFPRKLVCHQYLGSV